MSFNWRSALSTAKNVARSAIPGIGVIDALRPKPKIQSLAGTPSGPVESAVDKAARIRQESLARTAGIPLRNVPVIQANTAEKNRKLFGTIAGAAAGSLLGPVGPFVGSGAGDALAAQGGRKNSQSSTRALPKAGDRVTAQGGTASDPYAGVHGSFGTPSYQTQIINPVTDQYTQGSAPQGAPDYSQYWEELLSSSGQQSSPPSAVSPNSEYSRILQELRSRVSGLSTMSAEEKAAQDEYNALKESARLGISGLEGQGRGIPLALVRGQQGKLEEQANIKGQTILERLSAAAAARQAALGAATGEYNAAAAEQQRLDELSRYEQQRADQFSQSQQNQEFQLLSNGYEPITGGLAEIQRRGLTPDQVIKIGGKVYVKPVQAAPTTDDIKEYEYARGSGYTGSFTDYMKAKGGSGASGSGYTLSPGQVRYDEFGNVIAQAAPSTANLPASVKSDLANTQTLLDLLSGITVNPDGTIAGVGTIQGRLPLGTLSDTGQNNRLALNNILSAIAKLRGGTSFTDTERALLESYTPKSTDTDSAISAKIRNLQSYLNTLNNNIYEQYGVQGDANNIQSDARYQQLKNSGFTDDEIREYLNFTNAPSTAVNGSLNSFKAAIAKQESGGRYNAVGPVTAKGNRAYGKYQVMDFNIPSWTKEALGRSLSVQDFYNSPQAQEAVANYKFNQLYNQYGNWADVASVWFSGRPVARAGNASDVTGTTVPRYVQNILSMMG